MNKQECYQMGADWGSGFREHNSTMQEAWEAEGTGRQFSPFEFTAHEFNSLPEDGRADDGKFTISSEDAWQAFEDGINSEICKLPDHDDPTILCKCSECSE